MTSTESVIVSWLKHIDKCQITQTNWGVAYSSWELQSEDNIKKLMDITDKFFSKNYKWDLYENNSTPLLFLHQGNIDVLGLMINSNVSNIYAISINNSENALDVDSSLNLCKEIIKKMIRTALLIVGYLNTPNAKIIFVTPKMHEKLYETLITAISGLNNIFNSMGYDFTFDFYTNESYRKIIFEPVNELIKAPTKAELSIKRDQIYQPSLLKETSLYTENNVNNNSDSDIITPKIGKLIRVEFEKLIDKGLLTEEIVQNLCDSKYSKEIFDLRFPMLKKYNDEPPLIEQRLIKGNGRYYSHIYYINGQKYLLTNDWYERNRSKLLMWIGMFA
jgi:hypothetical protein